MIVLLMYFSLFDTLIAFGSDSEKSACRSLQRFPRETCDTEEKQCERKNTNADVYLDYVEALVENISHLIPIVFGPKGQPIQVK